MWIELALTLTGLLLGFFLFFRHPRLPKPKIPEKIIKVSVIIPARNEERNIASLVHDLQNQTFKPLEIIVVDDQSSDKTHALALEAGATVLSVIEKPSGWMGKTWACHIGSENAHGDLLLFIDADVRLDKHALAKLVTAHLEKGDVITVQPYHTMKKGYERFSLFFNMVEVCADGVTPLIRGKKVGLFGPIILIPKTTYDTIQGHRGVKNALVDDLSLGISLRNAKIPFSIYLGKKDDISFRMYPDGYRSLWQGWVKNFATGAAATPFWLLLGLVLWTGTGLGAIGNLGIALLQGKWTFAYLFGAVYLIYGLSVWIEARRIGHYRFWTVFIYPLMTLHFYLLFFVSLFKKIFRRKVVWKDRKVWMEK